MDFAIKTDKLGRIYKIRGGKKQSAKELIALQDVSLEVYPGECFGLLGPNGAGKTTLIKILTTLLAPTTGSAQVAGFDVVENPQAIRQRINMVSGGEASGYGLLTVRENLWMFSQFYGLPSAEANRRIKHMLEVVGLADRINTKSSDLSTGLRQKMNIVRGFLTDPEVLFLDEPTLGLDVGASHDVRNFIRGWINEDQQRTLLLTTHYMVEADDLCDRVAIINRGQVLTCDTPANLKRRLQRSAIFRFEVSPLNGLGIETFERMPGVEQVQHARLEGCSVLEIRLVEESVISEVVSALTSSQVRILNLQKREPSLEDVFVDLVGHSLEDAEKINQQEGQA